MDKALIDCKRLLEKKRKHREGKGGTDRLDQFKRGAALRDKKVSDSVGDMMSKHVTQLFTMLEEESWGEDIPFAQWKEVIYDSINYHLLLFAALSEEKGE